MTANRRADLQRKLSMAPVPQPPAGLADRIKKEIPKELRFSAEQERARFSKSVLFSMRGAASILLLISASYVGLRVLSRAGTEKNEVVTGPAAKRESPQSVATNVAAPPAVEPAQSPAPTIVAQRRVQPRDARQRAKVAALQTNEKLRDQRKDIAADQQQTQVPAVANDAAAGAAETRAELEKKTDALAAKEAPARITATLSAPAAPPPLPAPPPPAAAPAPVFNPEAPSRSVAEAITVTSRAAIKAKQRSIDDAWVQHFAEPAAIEPGTIALDVEATENPLAPGEVLIRASFDVGAVARDVHLDLVPSAGSAPSARWLAMTSRWSAPEFTDTSRSTIVALARPSDDAIMAVVRAFYTIGSATSQQTMEKVVRRADIKPWAAASPRTKSAALAALWRKGADRAAVAAAARAAGLDELTAAIER